MNQLLQPRALRNSPWSTIGETGTKKKWTLKRKTKSPPLGGLRVPRTKKKFLPLKPRNRRAARTIGAWVDSKLPTNREARDGSRRRKLQRPWRPWPQRQAVASR